MGLGVIVNLDRILAELRSERDRLDEAIAAIEKIGTAANGTGRRRGRPGRPAASAAPNGRRRRRMSAAARKRISEMMKARWAERRKKRG